LLRDISVLTIRPGPQEWLGHPDYGDGPYTISYKRKGLKVLVYKQARASLVYEAERRLLPFWRVLVNVKRFLYWVRYYLGSFKSPFQLRNRWNQNCYYRGRFLAPFYYLCSLGRLLGGIAAASLLSMCFSVGKRRQWCGQKLGRYFPENQLESELTSLT